MCPHQESNRKPFDTQKDAQPTEQQQLAQSLSLSLCISVAADRYFHYPLEEKKLEFVASLRQKACGKVSYYILNHVL